MDAIQKNLLEQVAELHDVPEGAYNIRANGKAAARNTTANIDIVSKEDKDGIDIIIKFELGFGFAFELPLIVFYLAVFHIVPYATFRAAWRYVYVIMLVVSASITPDASPVTLIFMYAVMLSLYEVALMVTRFVVMARDGKAHSCAVPGGRAAAPPAGRSSQAGCAQAHSGARPAPAENAVILRFLRSSADAPPQRAPALSASVPAVSAAHGRRCP